MVDPEDDRCSDADGGHEGVCASIAVGVALFIIMILGRVYGGSNRSRLAFVLSPFADRGRICFARAVFRAASFPVSSDATAMSIMYA